MRKLPITGKIKLSTISQSERDQDVYETIISALSTPEPNQGINYSEMLSRCEIIKKVQEANKKLEGFCLLEESEYGVFNSCLKSLRFVVCDPAIFDWIKSVTELPDIKVVEEEKAEDKSK